MNLIEVHKRHVSIWQLIALLLSFFFLLPVGFAKPFVFRSFECTSESKKEERKVEDGQEDETETTFSVKKGKKSKKKFLVSHFDFSQISFTFEFTPKNWYVLGFINATLRFDFEYFESRPRHLLFHSLVFYES